ncbi:TPA: hypothetical protein DCL30_00480 [Candidatus Peribacteria bacterium]|nr:MAG: hypothetical protein A3J91_02045 [Candidatus Peribacteria bacterium RIFOXYC2_FULL_58_10]OGJ84436.1 MAG: hypothetical protein A2529_03545 [Candidatus Peribacteria bacterium RIFOXYD2_FULL_58_15]HAI98005.1 hypothetical protein [Candidatus Peribacteria bacterium]HAS34629.1 hypothetical protein [Candidatus Peribacteria bacterium]
MILHPPSVGRALLCLTLVLLTWTLSGKTPVMAAPRYECNGGAIPAIEELLDALEPVSTHFVGAVLERAQAGIDKAMTASPAPGLDSFWNWLETAFTPVAMIADTKTRIATRERDLIEVTPCLEIDLAIIEAKMGQVQCKIELAFDEKRLSAIILLSRVLYFLNDEYQKLAEHGNDNSYVDAEWWQRRIFDPAEWCCIANTKNAEGEMCDPDDACPEVKTCPFHSDYLPPSTVGSGTAAKPVAVGYGCDLSVLSRYAGLGLSDSTIDEATDAETTALEELSEDRDKMIEDSEQLKTRITKLEKFMGRSLPAESAWYGQAKSDKRVHRLRLGCAVSDGRNADNQPAAEDWPPAWPAGAAKWELTGPFSFDKNDQKLLREYLQLRDEWGQQRPYPDQYKFPEEFLPDRPEKYEEALDDPQRNDFFVGWINRLARTVTKKWDRVQEREEGAMVPIASEALEIIMEQLSPLRLAVSEFSKNGNSLDKGVRNFTRGLAYWLRRSCLTRPCNARLERVLKIDLTNDCFPYTNGQFVGRTDLVEKCTTSAEL